MPGRPTRFLRVSGAAVVLVLSLFGWFCEGAGPRPDQLPESDAPETPVPPYADVERKLSSAVWSERSNAVLDALRGNYRQAIPTLRRLMSADPHQAVRDTSALALADFGQREIVPELAAMLVARRGVSAEVVVEVFRRLKDPRGAPSLVPLLESDQHVLRLKVVEAIGGMQARGQIARILGMAQANKDPERAKTYAMVLGQLKAREAEAYLVRLAETSQPGPTLAAAYLALGRIGSRRGVPVLVRALAANFPKGRENATEALIAIRDPRAVEGAFPLLSHSEEEIRYAAAEVICEVPHPATDARATELLRRAGAGGNDRPALGPAALILGRRKVASARPDLERLLADRSLPDRDRLARALGGIGDKGSVALLIRVLQESSGSGRYGAAAALGVMEAVEAIPALQEAARSSDRRLAGLAIEALGGMGTADTLRQLHETAKKDESLAPFAIESIALSKLDEARLILEDLARTGEGTLQRQAIVALGRRRDPRSVPALIALLESARAEQHRSLFLSLSQSTGQRFGNRNAWLNWYRQSQRDAKK